MKTDPFDDAIRRKLDDVNPPFQEKNWTQFQRFMGSQGFPPSLWQSPARWLQPALAAAAVAGMVVASVWQYRSNQALRVQMQTLTKTVQRLEEVQTRLQQSIVATSRPARVDTVYLTQRTDAGTLPGDRLGTLTNASSPGTYPRLPPRNDVTVDMVTSASSQPFGRTGQQSKTRQRAINQPANKPLAEQSNGSTLYSNPVGKSSIAGRNVPAGSPDAGSTNVPEGPTAESPATSGALTNLHLLTPLPLPDQSGALAQSWQHHLRRIRTRSTYAQSVAAASVAAVPAKNTTPINVQWRLGVGGDIGTVQSGFGAYAEAIIANHWKIGVGISEINWSGDTYSSEQQFKVKTRHDFRQYYPASGPPPAPVLVQRREVENISRAGQSLVIPIQLGYRISLGSQYAFTPAAGVNFSIDPHELITYTIGSQTTKDNYLQNVSIDRPVNRYSNWTLGFGLERQWSRFVGQLNPILTVPLSGVDAGLNKPSVGIGGRLFYRL